MKLYLFFSLLLFTILIFIITQYLNHLENNSNKLNKINISKLNKLYISKLNENIDVYDEDDDYNSTETDFDDIDINTNTDINTDEEIIYTKTNDIVINTETNDDDDEILFTSNEITNTIDDDDDIYYNKEYSIIPLYFTKYFIIGRDDNKISFILTTSEIENNTISLKIKTKGYIIDPSYQLTVEVYDDKDITYIEYSNISIYTSIVEFPTNILLELRAELDDYTINEIFKYTVISLNDKMCNNDMELDIYGTCCQSNRICSSMNVTLINTQDVIIIPNSINDVISPNDNNYILEIHQNNINITTIIVSFNENHLKRRMLDSFGDNIYYYNFIQYLIENNYFYEHIIISYFQSAIKESNECIGSWYECNVFYIYFLVGNCNFFNNFSSNCFINYYNW